MNLALSVTELLKKHSLTLSTAESCTGGLVAKCLTDIPGASSVFWGGVVSYDNSVKMGLLGVDPDSLDAYGAVSPVVAEQMAKGVCLACKTDIGVSTTGIAGPGGGTPEKPVGTVYIGVCIKGIAYSKRLCICPTLSRDEIRHEATSQLLSYVIDKINEIY